MKVIQGKRGWIRIHEPTKEITKEGLENFHRTVLKCLLSIQKDLEEGKITLEEDENQELMDIAS